LTEVINEALHDETILKNLDENTSLEGLLNHFYIKARRIYLDTDISQHLLANF
jgi:hypothetical protein